MKVLGLDPGLASLGWGVVERVGSRWSRVADGIIIMHREDKYPTSKENIDNASVAGIVDMVAPKLRGVEDNTFGRMRFRGEVQRFEPIVSAQEEPKGDDREAL